MLAAKQDYKEYIWEQDIVFNDGEQLKKNDCILMISNS